MERLPCRGLSLDSELSCESKINLSSYQVCIMQSEHPGFKVSPSGPALCAFPSLTTDRAGPFSLPAAVCTQHSPAWSSAAEI